MARVRKILSYWKSIGITACILYLSFAPASTFKSIPTFENEDKLIHFLMYFGLAAVLLYDYTKTNKNQNATHPAFVLICLVYPSVLGGLIEVLQPMYFNRSASWFDFMADVIGVLSGWLIMKILIKKLIVKYL
jgi:VanZ like family.